MPEKPTEFHLPRTFTLDHLDAWSEVADFLVNIEVKTVLLNGNLGAGKTTFVKYLVKALGAQDAVSSPTFSIVNTYESKELKIYHMDLYRLESYDELFNAGIEEYFYEDSAICIVEWPDLILESDLVDSAVTLNIEVIDGKRRVVVCIVD